jgi:hypothetical protein
MAIALGMVPLGLTSAQVLWRGDFETGDLSQWSQTLNERTRLRHNITVVDSPRFGGKYAAQLVIHPDDLFSNGHNRVELHHDGMQTGEGQTTFFSWRFRLHADAGTHEDIAYWETKGPEYRQSMAFYLDPVKGGSRLGFRINLPEAREYWSAPVTSEEWHQLAMKITWSKSSASGRVSVWFDGRHVVDDLAASTKPNGADLFIQMGFHRDSFKESVETIYIDDAREGASLEDVLAAPEADAGKVPSQDPPLIPEVSSGVKGANGSVRGRSRLT